MCAEQDNNAQVDMNVVMNSKGNFIEVQSTAEEKTFSERELKGMLKLAQKGIKKIIRLQRKTIKL